MGNVIWRPLPGYNPGSLPRNQSTTSHLYGRPISKWVFRAWQPERVPGFEKMGYQNSGQSNDQKDNIFLVSVWSCFGLILVLPIKQSLMSPGLLCNARVYIMYMRMHSSKMLDNWPNKARGLKIGILQNNNSGSRWFQKTNSAYVIPQSYCYQNKLRF